MLVSFKRAACTTARSLSVRNHRAHHPRTTLAGVAKATALVQEDILQIYIKQYKPLNNPYPQLGALTLVSAHANGFLKEAYEVVWMDFQLSSKVAAKSK